MHYSMILRRRHNRICRYIDSFYMVFTLRHLCCSILPSPQLVSPIWLKLEVDYFHTILWQVIKYFCHYLRVILTAFKKIQRVGWYRTWSGVKLSNEIALSLSIETEFYRRSLAGFNIINHTSSFRSYSIPFSDKQPSSNTFLISSNLDVYLWF
jgi:hypothetical protein